MKIIFADLNKELKEKVKKGFKEWENNTHCELIVSKKDVLETKKLYPNALIVTASNPDFTMSGGLDATLKKAYPDQCENVREFKFTKDLFFTISCDESIKTNRDIIKRALLGVYFASREYNIILTGLGTNIAGLSIDDFLKELELFVNANFSNADFSNTNFSDFDFSFSDFSFSNFNYSNFSYSNVSNSNFHNSNFYNSDFSFSNFSNTDFSRSDFSNSVFSCSDFRSANFNNTCFERTNFNNSDFKSVNFSNSNFSNTNFHNADFSNSDFSYSDFNNTNFHNTNFNNSDFSYSNFHNSNFYNSNFSYSDFNNIDFRNANFSKSNFNKSNFSNVSFNYRITPEEGVIIGWKKANKKIVKLEINCSDEISGGLISRKLRTNKVKVLEIQNIDGTKVDINEIRSDYDEYFVYRVGETIEIGDFVKDDKIECARGIHFFLTRNEAIHYNF